MDVLQMFLDLVNNYPVVGQILIVVGALRLVMKPLFSIAHSVVEYTQNPKDNLVLGKVESHWAVKGFLYLLDWFGSVKMPKKQ